MASNLGRILSAACALLIAANSRAAAHGGSQQPAPGPVGPVGPIPVVGPFGPIIRLPFSPLPRIGIPGLFGRGGRMNQIAVLMVNFENYRQRPFSREQVHEAVLGASDAWYREVSYGKQPFSGSVFGWYELDMAIKDCSKVGEQLGEMQDKAIEAADRDVDYARFGRVIIIYPECGLGWGSVGTRRIKTDDSFLPLEFSVSWMRTLDSRVVLHELGHNLSLQHAASYACDGAVLSTDCEDREYGDSADAMGSAPRHFNAYHKRKLGWISDSQFPRVPEKKGMYRYRITPMETAGGIKGVRVPMTPGTGAEDPSGIDSEFILELRRNIGFDESLASTLVDGLLVHIPFKNSHAEDQASFEHTHLLDMDPEGADLVLRPGKSWTSPNQRVTLTAGSLTADGIELTVTLDYADSRSWWETALDSAGDFLGGLFSSVGRAAGALAHRPLGSREEAPASGGLDGVRAAGLPSGAGARTAASAALDSTGFSGNDDASGTVRLAGVPEAGLRRELECSSPLRRLPSALRARFDAEARARGISSSPVACLTPGEYLAHRSYRGRLAAGDPKGAADAFRWEGYAVLAAERALGR